MREEREAVNIVAESLRALEIEVWFDADITHGAGLDEQITTELDSAACVLNCWTPATLCSLPKSPGRARQQRDRCRPGADAERTPS
jgi:hypothetical protein